MRALILVLAVIAPLVLPDPVRADTADDIRATYLAFVDAQNGRDPVRIGAFFVDKPDLLWVSDGRSYWGRDAILARMGSFQKAEVWRVEPDLGKAVVTELSDDVAMLHLSLTLVIGPGNAPSRLRFLVSLIFVRDVPGWRIAALLTTTAKE